VLVLDTDMLTLVQRKGGKEYETLVSRINAAGDQPVCVTIVSLEEQMRGWLAWISKARSSERLIEAYGKLHALVEDFRTRPILDLDSLAMGDIRALRKPRFASVHLTSGPRRSPGE
jgi:tRNA(fMet)-specific endonuclease VapC